MARPVGAFNRESFSPLILDAARELATPERAPTRREIAAHLMLSTREIQTPIDNLRRTGRLLPVRLRTVAHRTRPVAEYAPADAVQAPSVQAPAPDPRTGWEDLQRCMERCWR
jgi:hypothetical protein